MVQRGLRSDYSHAAVATNRGSVVESYDYRLTMREDDDGVVETSFEDFHKRHHDANVLSLYRPEGLNVDAALASMQQIAANPRPYPTAGIVVLAVAVWTARLAGRQRVGSLRERALRRLVDRQLIVAGDGPSRMHCSELVARLYCASGLQLEFKPLALDHPVDEHTVTPRIASPTTSLEPVEQRAYAPHSLRSPQPEIMAVARTGVGAAYDLCRALAARRRQQSQIDLADIVSPQDLSTANPMVRVARAKIDQRRMVVHFESPALPWGN